MNPTCLAQFRAIYCSGMFIPDEDAVPALALLFEKVRFPNNTAFIRSFATKYRVRRTTSLGFHFKLTDNGEEIFADLAEHQRETAKNYVLWSLGFADRYQALFGSVFESELFGGGQRIGPEVAHLNIVPWKDTRHDDRNDFVRRSGAR